MRCNKTCPACERVYVAASGSQGFCSDACRVRGNVNRVGDCLLWQAGVDKDGYGVVMVGGGKKRRRAHRVFYTEFVGPIPDGLHVLHRCDTPACVEPSHLFLGTIQDNKADEVAKGRQARGEGCGKSKLTEAQAFEALTGPHPSAHYAEKFGVNYVTIWAVRSRRTWKHLGLAA